MNWDETKQEYNYGYFMQIFNLIGKIFTDTASAKNAITGFKVGDISPVSGEPFTSHELIMYKSNLRRAIVDVAMGSLISFAMAQIDDDEDDFALKTGRATAR